jgi:cytochrome c2
MSEHAAPDLMIQYGCPACHVIPRVPGAVGQVGPSLAGLGQRSYIAGTLPNTPENLVSWIMHPQHFRPGTAMPEMGVTEQDAHRIQIFLVSTW